MFWLYPDAWTRVYTGLGYGWVPALLWTGAALVTLRYRPAWLARYWNLWLAGACRGSCEPSAPCPSLTRATDTLAFVGLAGRWGSAAMGDSMVWGMVRLAPLVAVVPLLISSRRAGRGYWLALSCTGKGLWLAALYTVLGIAYAARAYRQRARVPLPCRKPGPGWITAIVKSPVRLFSAYDRTVRYRVGSAGGG